jgi:hypothetical protein
MLLEKGHVIVMDGDVERALLDVVAVGFLKVEVMVTTEVALGLDHCPCGLVPWRVHAIACRSPHKPANDSC